MSVRRIRVLAVVLAALFTAQPVFAVGGLQAVFREAPAAPEPGAGDREEVARRLVDLGSAEPAAKRAAGLLTAADLQVLAANPGMLQTAGAMSQRTQAYLIGGLIIGGLIALAVVSDSAFFTTNGN